jgi:hypothetical protein
MTITPNDGANTVTFSSTASGIGGSGSYNYIPKFTGSTTVGSSVIYDLGGMVGINGALAINTTTFEAYLSIKGNEGIVLWNDSSQRRARINVTSSDAGFQGTYGPNDSWNTRLSCLTDYPNNGYIAVRDAADVNQAKMYVNSSGQGVVSADVKSFCMANPNQPGTEIWYACPEGPEAAAYVRGTGHLANGEAEIILPDHFVAVASVQGLTVHLTPLSAESKGLAVVEKSPEQFIVRELASGKGSYDFDYTVMAVRKGYEDYRVIRSASEAQDAESVADAE